MSVGEKLIMLPGPTNVPSRVLLAMSRPVINHRGQEFHVLYNDIQEKIKKVYETENIVIILSASGTGGVEFATFNFLGRGDRVVVPILGEFSERLAEAVERAGAEVVRISVEYGRGVTLDQIRSVVERDSGITAIALVFNETSTGVSVWDVERIGSFAHERGILYIVDSISALGGVKLPTDRAYIDVHIAGSQKCIATPPGLSFVSVSKDAIEKSRRLKERRTYYFDLESYLKFHERSETPYTPALPLFFALDEALTMILEEGLENYHKRHEILSAAMYSALEALNIPIMPEKMFRSKTVVASRKWNNVDTKQLRRIMEEKYGVVVAGEIGSIKNVGLRIGVMGMVNAGHIIRTVSALEAALMDMKLIDRVGAGIEAALKVINSY
ncbi:MAG: alanine--glyoxylate aminotransferase family protein [Thermoprotei archaeon]